MDVIQVCSYSNTKRGETQRLPEGAFMPAQLYIAYVIDYSGGLYCARAEYVGTYTHTINTYTSYFYHFDTLLQTVNQIIPNFIHSL